MAQNQLNQAAVARRVTKTNKHGGTRCPWCFQFYKEKIVRHMENACKHCPVNADRRKAAVAMERERMAAMSNQLARNVFFNPAEIEERMFTKAEVCHLLERWGHQAVPENMEECVYLAPTACEHVIPRFAQQAYLDRLRNAKRMVESHVEEQGEEQDDKDDKVVDMTVEEQDSEFDIQMDTSTEEEAEEQQQPSRREDLGNTETIDKGSDSDNNPDKEQKVQTRKKQKPLELHSSPDETPMKKKPRKKSSYGHKITERKTPKFNNTINIKNYMTGIETKGVERELCSVPKSYAQQSLFRQFEQYHKTSKKVSPTAESFSDVMSMCYWMSYKEPILNFEYLTTYRFRQLVDTVREKFNYSGQAVVKCIKNMQHFLNFLRKDSALKLKLTIKTEYDRLKDMDSYLAKMLKEFDQIAKQEVKANSHLPATPYEVQEVIRIAQYSFEALMDKAARRKLTKAEIDEVNRHFCCKFCLEQGTLPEAVENVTQMEFGHGLEQTFVEDGKTICVLAYSRHKISAQHQACIVLDEYWTGKLKEYYKNIRREIVTRTGTTRQNLILQYDGNSYWNISNGIHRYQLKHGIKPFTAKDARISYLTYSKDLDQQTKDNIRNYLGYSKDDAERVYRYANDQFRSKKTC